MKRVKRRLGTEVEPGNHKSDKEQAKTDAIRKWGLI